MIKKQSFAGRWALGTCYMDRKEYYSVLPSAHVLVTFAGQDTVFVRIVRALSDALRTIS